MQFELPEGYSFDAPEGQRMARTLTDIPGEALYAGADISQEHDASGAHYVACCARGPGAEPTFRFRAFRKEKGGASYSEVPLPFVSSGRGEQSIQWYDGKNWVIAWNQNIFNFDVVPGFAPFPSIPELLARIVALEARPLTGGSAPVVPTEDATPLWVPDYVSQAELDSSPGEYVRINRLKAAVVQLRRLAAARGELR